MEKAIIDEQEMTFDQKFKVGKSQKGLSRACHPSQRGITARSNVLRAERDP